jgi:ABC-type Zn uptake system ZnuABC Zn-binding protein ZnuA
MRRLAVFLVLLVILSSCAQPATSQSSNTGNLVVLATTTFLADIARNVAGDRVSVDSLLPFGTDPHSYQPIPADAVKISKSTVLIANGLDYEQFLTPLLQSAGGQRLIITASNGLEARQMQEEGHIVRDPHMWLDPNRVIKYVENIRDGLSQADPSGAATYKSNADAYILKLHDLDSWIKEEVANIPAKQRLLATNHQSLGYFAERYGFTIVGEILQSASSVASPSAQQIANLIDQIKKTHAPAVFLDVSDNPDLARQIAEDTGIHVVTDLHLESLTDGAPAGTYIDMMKYNVTQIVSSLR